MRIKLSILMFFQVFVFGAVVPIFSIYLMDSLGFSGTQAGFVTSLSGIAAFISTFIVLYIADRVINVKNLLALCHLSAAVLMLLLSFQSNFTNILILYFLYMIVLSPTSALVNALTFEYLSGADKNFGKVRMWGSIGWVGAGWILSIFWLGNGTGGYSAENLVDAIRLSACVSLIIFLLLKVFLKSKQKIKLTKPKLPKEAFKIVAKPKNLALCIIIFFITGTFHYYNFGMSPFLSQNNYSESFIMLLLSICQITEILGFATVSFFIEKIGYKKVILAGLFLAAMRDIALLFSSSLPSSIIAISGEGLSNAFFLTSYNIYFNRQSSSETRAGVQQILGIITVGFSAIIGNFSAGLFHSWSKAADGSINYTVFWLPMIFISAFSIIIFLFSNRKQAVDKKQEEIPYD